jgi:hypothetical protein
MYKHASEYINHEFHIDSYYNNLNFIYNSENRLIEVSNSNKKHFIKYDLIGNIILIEGVFQDSDYDHKVEYKWNGNDLIQKKIFKNASLENKFIQYDISRTNNSLIIEKRNEYNVLEFKATLMVDNKDLVKEKLLENFKNSDEEITGFSRIYYKYDINDNLVDITSDYYSKAKSKASAFIEANYGNPITHENGELYIGPKKVLTKIIRDAKGNEVKRKRTVINKKSYMKDKDYGNRYGQRGVWSRRSEYFYDYLGNWIKKIEFDVLDDDSRIRDYKRIIYRSIEYY